ncbi:MAG: UbiA family prenyltransferase [Halobacteriales archaeon]|nr:UbiA family prenyltransferase [Halobacteriales archaeon]
MAETSGTDAFRLRPPVKTAVEFLVHSNLFVSFSATGVALTTVLLADLRLDPVPLFIVFSVTLFVYSFNRFTDLAEDEKNVPRRARFTRRYGKPLLTAGVVLYIAVLVLAFTLELPGAPFLLLPVFVGAVYSLARAKRVLLVKNLIVGGAWGAIPLGVGVYYGVLLTPEILFLSGFFIVSVTVAAALFDIKDIEGDRREGIRTVPNVYGPRLTRVAAFVVVSALVPAVVGATFVISSDFAVLFGFLGYVLGYIPFATRDRGTLFYGFVIDGEYLFVALLTVAVVYV